MQNRRVALIPAYQPNSDMAQLVQEIKDTGFQIVVVDDGSSPEKEEVFRMAAKNAVILKHNENRGKGRALKTGLDYIYSKFSADCVVGGVSFTGGIGKISGVVVGVFIFTALTYSLTILGIDTNLQFVFSGIIILVAVTLDCLKYVQKK